MLPSAGGGVNWHGGSFDPEWRLYARSSGDDKAPILAILTAVDAIRAAGDRGA